MTSQEMDMATCFCQGRSYLLDHKNEVFLSDNKKITDEAFTRV
jgi:hypothetical protein